MHLELPGLLAVEQAKSALRGRRNSCRVIEPLEADMLLVSGAAGALFCPVGFPFKHSSSTFKASLFSAMSRKHKTTLGSHFISPQLILGKHDTLYNIPKCKPTNMYIFFPIKFAQLTLSGNTHQNYKPEKYAGKLCYCSHDITL